MHVRKLYIDMSLWNSQCDFLPLTSATMILPKERNAAHRHFRLKFGPIITQLHDDVIQWKHFHRYWPFLWGNLRSPLNAPHKGPWRVALMFSLICAWINGWENNRGAGDLRRHRAHYHVIVIFEGCCGTVFSLIYPFFHKFHPRHH